MTIRSEHARWLHEYESELKRTGEHDMGRYASEKGGGDFKQCPPGNHVARCVSLVDLGTQHGEYLGAPTVREQIVVRWEVPGETIEVDGVEKPLLVSKFYTNSLSEKANMRRDLEAWRGRPFTPEELKKFDLATILGKPCLVNVIHNESGKAKVTGVSSMPKGMTCPPAVNPLASFWMDEWDDNAFAALPEGFKKIIEQSDEYKALHSTTGQAPKADDGYDQMRRPEQDETDDIPF